MKTSNYLTVLILTLISFSSFSQCKLDVDKIDPITGDKYLQTKKIRIKQNSNFVKSTKIIGLTFSRKGETISLVSSLYAGVLANETINNPRLLFKLDNGDLITLIPDNATLKLYELIFKFQIPENDLKKLANNNIVAIQLSFNALEELFELKKKDFSKIREDASCLVK